MKKLTTTIVGVILVLNANAFTVTSDSGAITPVEKFGASTAPVIENSQAFELPKVGVSEEDKIFTHVEIKAAFVQKGGWKSFVQSAIESNMEELVAEGTSVTCRVSFIVSKDGTITNVKALTMKDSKLAEIAVNAIKKAPKWIPAQQNGNKVNMYMEQTITFIIEV